MTAAKSKPKALPFADFANSALLEFPTDQYGITRELRRTMIDIGSRLNGDIEKLELVVVTLDLLQKHLQARYDEVVAAREAAAELEAAKE